LLIVVTGQSGESDLFRLRFAVSTEIGGTVRWLSRFVVVTGALAMLSSIPTAASADEMYLGLRSVTCSGLTVTGSGLPPSTRVSVTLLDSVHGRQLDRRALSTSASGAFTWQARVALSGLRSVRALVSRTGATSPIAWTDHTVPTACPLAYTGAGGTLPLIVVGLVSLLVGSMMVTAFGYRGRHVGVYRGRHMAAR
jgi:hypothetical protein